GLPSLVVAPVSSEPVNCGQKLVARSRLVANRIDNIPHPAGNQGAAGKHNHRKLRPAVLDRSGDCLAVHFWHFIINNYGICGIRIDKIQSQASARGSENTKTQSLKNSFEQDRKSTRLNSS